MKKISLSMLIIAFVLTASIGEVFAAATAYTSGADIAVGTFARQNDVFSFTASTNVNLTYTVSTSGENYAVSAGHTSGDKEYGMDSTGGPTYSRSKTAGSATLTGAPTASNTGSAPWTGWTAQ